MVVAGCASKRTKEPTRSPKITSARSKRKDQKICKKLDLRNRIFQENRAKDCQEIEELRRICREETDRARHLKFDELSLQQ